jgi:hypothetical protein
VVERTNSWQNAHKKLVWCTERTGRVIDFWIAFLERDRHRGQAPPKSLDPLPLGGSTLPPTMNYWRKLLVGHLVNYWLLPGMKPPSDR